MNLTLIQWGFVSIFGVLISRLCWQLMSGSIPRGRGLYWLLLWSSGLALVLRPEMSMKLAEWLGVSRGTDAVVYLAIAFLSVLIFRTFRLLDLQDHQISELTTALALRDLADGEKVSQEIGESPESSRTSV